MIKKTSFLVLYFILTNIICALSLSNMFASDSLKDFIIFEAMNGSFSNYELWKVNSNGLFEKIKIEYLGGGGFSVGKGCTTPLLSNDLSKIAYINKGELCIYDVKNKTHNTITKISSRSDTLYNPISILLSGYSKNDNYLLYNVDYEIFPEEKDKPTKAIKYGFFLYDFRKKINISIELPYEYIGWMGDDELLLKNESNRKSEYFYYNIKTKEHQLLYTIPCCNNQEYLNPNEWVVLINNCDGAKVNIQELDFNTREINTVHSSFGCASMQSAKYSPDGTKISLLSHDKRGKTNTYKIIVDYSTIYEVEETKDISIAYNWISDTTILIQKNNSYFVKNLTNGAIISEKHFTENR